MARNCICSEFQSEILLQQCIAMETRERLKKSSNAMLWRPEQFKTLNVFVSKSEVDFSHVLTYLCPVVFGGADTMETLE